MTWTLQTINQSLHVPKRVLVYRMPIISVFKVDEKAMIRNRYNQIYILFHSLQNPSKRFEPPHDKTNKMAVRPAKTQISRSIRPV